MNTFLCWLALISGTLVSLSVRAQTMEERLSNCLLSVGFGAELRSPGYQGFPALSQTLTLNPAADKEAQ